MSRNTAHQRILAAGEELIVSGEVGWTIERLAAKAQVSRQTVYAHFPDRAAVLVAVVEAVRTRHDIDGLAQAVYQASTAREALVALVSVHAQFTPRVMHAGLAIELEAAHLQDVAAAFDRRDTGRRQLARHVVTRLAAEGDLDADWDVEAATDFVVAVFGAVITLELVERRKWTPSQLEERLLRVLERALIATSRK